jgi:hypothetical protein
MRETDEVTTFLSSANPWLDVSGEMSVARWVFTNHASVPVHVGLFNAGLVHRYVNDLQPYSESSCAKVDPNHPMFTTMPWMKAALGRTADGKLLMPDTCQEGVDMELIWWDVVVRPAAPDGSNRFKPEDNIEQGPRIGAATVGALLTVVGVVVAVATAGAATPGAIGAITFTASTIAAMGAVGTAGSVALTALDVANNIKDEVLRPAAMKNLYGGDEYLFVVDGGPQASGALTNGQVSIDRVEQLRLHWNNTKTKSSGMVTAVSP